MSLITRCPACGTMFKVVPDQLRISEGWVRCGHCAEVFDASAHLQSDELPLPTEATPTASSPLKTNTDSESSSEPTRDSEHFASSLNTEMDDGPIDPPDSAQLEEEARSLTENPLDRPFELRRQDKAALVDSRPPAAAPPVEREPELHDLSFVMQARRQAFWRSGGIRALLVVLLLVLGVTLLLQVAMHDRDRLAASDAQLRPWLVKLCATLNCRIGPPRQIDAIVIESSAFNKLRGETYRLNFTVKNQAPTEVAMPALELTLTDAQDQPVVRRVLMPTELGPAPAAIAAASDTSASLALAVTASGSGARIAGYRLLAFYP